MNINVKPVTVETCDIILDASCQEGIECDALLPDYCPDIMRILKCFLLPAVSDKKQSGRRLETEGVASAFVYYLSEEGEICSCQFKLPFAKTFNLLKEGDGGAAEVTVRKSYINCRAVNKRRLDIRGAVEIKAQVFSKQKRDFLGEVSCGDIEVLQEGCRFGRIAEKQERRVSVKEEWELSSDLPKAKKLIKTNFTSHITDVRCENGHATVKGDLIINILYLGENGRYVNTTEKEPFAAVTELPENENIKLCAEDEILFAELKESESGGFSLEAELLISVIVMAETKADIATDCYAVKGSCEFKKQPFNTVSVEDVFTKTCMPRLEAELPEGAEEVLGVWLSCEDTKLSCGEKGMTADIRITADMFIKTDSGEYICEEKTFDVNEALKDCCDFNGYFAHTKAGEVSFGKSGKNTVEIRPQLDIWGITTKNISLQAVEDLKEAPETEENKIESGIYIYMRDEGESLWSIGRHYHARLADIREENSVEGDDIPKALIIPVK